METHARSLPGRVMNLDHASVALSLPRLFPSHMAKAAVIDAAAAGWAHDIASIRDFMRETCVAYFATVPEFAEFILQ